MKILVIAASGIGDTLIATPLIHELRVQFPEAALHALVLWKGSRDLLEGNPHLTAVHQKNLIQDSKIGSIRFLLGLRRERFDVSINTHTQGRIHYRIVARIIGAPLRLSHQYENCGWLDRRLINRAVPQDYTVHSVENNDRLLRLLGREPLRSRRDLEVFVTLADEQWASSFIAENRLSLRKRLGIHLGSGGTKNLKLKRWPFQHWFALIQRLAKSRPNLAIVLFGGPEEQHEHEEILAALGGNTVFVPNTTNLRQAASLMKLLDGFLSVDTALMHLAAAVKVPNQIVIEAPTLNPTNLPWNTSFQIIRNPVLNGRNLEYYRYDGGPIRGSDEELRRIMASVTVNDVFQAVVKTLD